MTTDLIRIGKLTVEFEQASAWVRRYTDAESNCSSAHPYAYPAYDKYQTLSEPGILIDADLLAPVLLNVNLSLRSFYGLQRSREQLSFVLADNELDQDLAELADDKISEATKSIYTLLDDEEEAPVGVLATTLSKIVHRKRPKSLPLHDKWVRACYLGSDAVPRAGKDERSWAEYMVRVTLAMAGDLRTQRESFRRLQRNSLAMPGLSNLRLLDILAWHMGQLGATNVQVESE